MIHSASNIDMAEESTNKDGASKPGKKLPLKTMAVIAAVLLIEGGAISTVFMLTGEPNEAQAQGMADQQALEGEKPVEVPVISGKFQNTRTGRAYLYDTEIYIVVKTKYQDDIKQKIEASSAAIRSQVTTIFRRASPAQLNESDLATLTRQIRATLEQRFGQAPGGEAYIEDCFLAGFAKYRAG